MKANHSNKDRKGHITLTKLLRDYQCSEDDQSRKEAGNILRQKILDPGVIEREQMAVDSSTIFQESVIAADAFESVTNGMYNPEALAALDKIGEDSIFFPWKQLTLGIKAFYNEDIPELNKILTEIPEDSVPAALIPVFSRLSDSRAVPEDRDIPEYETVLISSIEKDNPILKGISDQLKDCLENEMEDLFCETAVMLIKEIYSSDPSAARKTALWAVSAAFEYDFTPTSLINGLKAVFGEAEGLRLTALSLFQDDPDLSLLFWIRALITRLHEENMEWEETGAHLSILSDLADAITELCRTEPDLFDAEYQAGYGELMKTLVHSLQERFPGYFDREWDYTDLETVYMLSKATGLFSELPIQDEEQDGFDKIKKLRRVLFPVKTELPTSSQYSWNYFSDTEQRDEL